MQTEEILMPVDTTLTVGQTLKAAREALGLQYRDLAAVTKIQPAMLKYMEEDRFEEFPAEVFARGFLRNYARELRLDAAKLLADYDAQRGTRRPTAVIEASVPVARTVVASTAPVATPFSDIAHFFEQGKAGRVAYAIAIALLVVGLALSVLVFSSSSSNSGTAAFQPLGAENNDAWRPAPEGQNDWRTYREN
jgi:transcriptional regulator with XRE-family HTH domain